MTTNTHSFDLIGADLRMMAFAGGDYSGACFRGCDLRGADFRGAQLQEVDFEDANLSFADCRGADFRNASLKNARIFGWIIEPKPHQDSAKHGDETWQPIYTAFDAGILEGLMDALRSLNDKEELFELRALRDKVEETKENGEKSRAKTLTAFGYRIAVLARVLGDSGAADESSRALAGTAWAPEPLPGAP